MKSLLVLRHAEAAPEGPDLPDFRRPLTEKGRTQANALGKWLQDRRINPDWIVCSAAVRARETADIVTAAAGWTAEVSPDEELYNASSAELLTLAKRQPDEVAQLMLVAHAPGVADLVGLLITRQVDVTLLYEAATLAEIVLEVEHWSEIVRGSGALRILLPS